MPNESDPTIFLALVIFFLGLVEAYRVFSYLKYGEKRLYTAYRNRIKLTSKLRGEEAAREEEKWHMDNFWELHGWKSIITAILAVLGSVYLIWFA